MCIRDRGDTIPVEYQDCRSLEDFFRVVAGERPAKEEVSFSSDLSLIHIYGQPIDNEHDLEEIYRILEKKKTGHTKNERHGRKTR